MLLCGAANASHEHDAATTGPTAHAGTPSSYPTALAVPSCPRAAGEAGRCLFLALTATNGSQYEVVGESTRGHPAALGGGRISCVPPTTPACPGYIRHSARLRAPPARSYATCATFESNRLAASNRDLRHGRHCSAFRPWPSRLRVFALISVTSRSEAVGKPPEPLCRRLGFPTDRRGRAWFVDIEAMSPQTTGPH
jgi:hypothetical protein